MRTRTWPRAMRRKLADRGWLTMGWPKEYGGQDASPITQLVFNEEMAYYRAPGKDAFGIGMLGPALMMHGTEEQKRKYLPAIAEGGSTGARGSASRARAPTSHPSRPEPSRMATTS